MFHVIVEVTENSSNINLPFIIEGNTTISTEPYFLDEYKYMDTSTNIINSSSSLSTTGKSKNKKKKNKKQSPSPTISKDHQSKEESQDILFFSGNPSIESIKGIFHLCKDTDERIINIANSNTSNTTDLWDTTIPVNFIFIFLIFIYFFFLIYLFFL